MGDQAQVPYTSTLPKLLDHHIHQAATHMMSGRLHQARHLSAPEHLDVAHLFQWALRSSVFSPYIRTSQAFNSALFVSPLLRAYAMCATRYTTINQTSPIASFTSARINAASADKTEWLSLYETIAACCCDACTVPQVRGSPS